MDQKNKEKDGNPQRQTVKTPYGDVSSEFLFFGKEAKENKVDLLHTFSEMQRTYLIEAAKSNHSKKSLSKLSYFLYLIEKLLRHS